MAEGRQFAGLPRESIRILTIDQSKNGHAEPVV